MKTRFVLRKYNTDITYNNKRFTKIEKAFELKEKLKKKGETDWEVYALTPFGDTLVFENEKWKWK